MQQEFLDKFYAGCIANDLDEIIDWINHAKKLHNVTNVAIARNISISERQLRRVLNKEISDSIAHKVILEICDFLNMRVKINVQLCPTRIPPKIVKDKYENEDKGITQIAHELGVAEHGVWRKLWNAGTKIRPFGIQAKRRWKAHNIDLETLKKEYDSGMPVSAIGIKYDATAATIYDRLHKAGAIRKQGPNRRMCKKQLKYEGEQNET